MTTKLRGAVIGYGGAFNMGKHHAQLMLQHGIDFAAACDLDPARAAQAKEDFPGIEAYTDPADLFAREDIDLITVITPHNTHAELGRRALEAGKHVILEKPMCIHADDGAELIRLARAKGRMLTVFHNRRWDGWYLTLKDLIAKGLLGDIFQMELTLGGFGRPRDWWRSDKKISGGALYDWGAHLIDYALGVVPGGIRSVRGVVQNLLWHEFTNEDHVESAIHMENGAVIRVQVSSLTHAARPHVVVQGTKGGIVDQNMFDGELTLYTDLSGVRVETKVPAKKDEGWRFYENVSAHLYRGDPLIVRPEEALRNIAVIETTERSAAEGRELPVPSEDLYRESLR